MKERNEKRRKKKMEMRPLDSAPNMTQYEWGNLGLQW